MSFGFKVRATTKERAKALVADELASVVKAQPIHAADAPHAQAAADAFIDVLRDDADREIEVQVSGSVWGDDTGLAGASTSVFAAFV